MLGNGALIDLHNENLSEKTKELLNGLVTYSKMDVVGTQEKYGDDYRKAIMDEGKLAFTLTNEMEKFVLSEEITEKEKLLIKPHLDRMLATTRGSLNIENKEIEDVSGYKAVQKIWRRRQVPKKGILEKIKGIFSKKQPAAPEPAEIEEEQELKMESKKDQALFPHEPSLNDIAQGGMGDCYFLAAISSVVSSNPEAIKSSMKDEGDTVVVRLYHPIKDDQGQETYEPKYYRVEKSVPMAEDGRDLFAAGSLWVQMLEKAYTASGLSVDESIKKSDEYKNREQGILHYDEIEGGYPWIAFSHIVGTQVQNADVRKAKKANELMNSFFSASEETMKQKQEIRNAGVPDDILDIVESNFLPKLLNIAKAIKSRGFMDMYFDKLRSYNRSINNDFGLLGITEIMGNYLSQHTGDADFDANAPTDALAAVDQKSTLLNMNAIVDMRNRQLDRSMTMEDFTAYIAKATIDTFPFSQEVTKKADKKRFLNMLKKFIRVRNPWGVGTREYWEQENKKVEYNREDVDNNGIFIVELNDFMNHFEKISRGEA